MSAKMLVLSLKDTRHVVAAASTEVPPEPLPAAEVVAGGVLPYRYVEPAVDVAAELLAVSVSAVDSNVIVNPAGFQLDDKGAPKALSAGAASIEAKTDKVTVKATNVTGVDALVVVIVHPSGPIEPLRVPMTNGEGTAALSSPTGSKFECLLAVPGFPLRSVKVDVVA